MATAATTIPLIHDSRNRLLSLIQHNNRCTTLFNKGAILFLRCRAFTHSNITTRCSSAGTHKAEASIPSTHDFDNEWMQIADVKTEEKEEVPLPVLPRCLCKLGKLAQTCGFIPHPWKQTQKMKQLHLYQLFPKF